MLAKGRNHSLITLIGIAAIGLTICHTKAAHAAPIIYKYTGTATAADASTGLAPGVQFTGTFTYDPAVFPSDYLGGSSTYSKPFDPPYSGGPGVTFAVEGQDIMSSSWITVSTTGDPANPDPSRTLSFVGTGPSSLDGRQFRTEIDLLSPSGIDVGPLGPTPPSSQPNFSEGILNMTWSNETGTHLMLSGMITSVTATTVPEPRSASVFGLAAIAWLAHARRRRSAAGLQTGL